jgi:hypothetical protein
MQPETGTPSPISDNDWFADSPPGPPDPVVLEMLEYAEVVRAQQELRRIDQTRLDIALRTAVDFPHAEGLRATARQIDITRSVAESDAWTHHRLVLHALTAPASETARSRSNDT